MAFTQQRHFLIEHIGIYQNNSSTPTWLIPDQEWIYPQDVEILNEDGTTVIIRFNRSVDLATVGSEWLSAIRARDLSNRLDGQSISRYGNHVSVSNMSWGPYNGNSNAQLTFKLDNGTSTMVKLQEAVLNIYGGAFGLKSSTGEELAEESTGDFPFRTEMPGVEIVLKEIEIQDDTDMDFISTNKGDIYLLYTILHGSVGGLVENSDIIPGLGTGDDPDNINVDKIASGGSKEYNSPLYNVSKLGPMDYLSLDLRCHDKDDDEFILALQDFFEHVSTVAGQLAQEFMELPPNPTAAHISSILVGVSATSRAVAALIEAIPDLGMDAHLGSHLWGYGFADWWGKKRGSAPQANVDAGKVVYTIEYDVK